MKVLVIGNSDGIGLTLTRKMLARGWQVCGISRSASPVSAPAYTHHIEDVTATAYREVLDASIAGFGPSGPRVVVYCVGIGDLLDTDNLEADTQVFEANLMGAVVTLERVLPVMLAAGEGHFVGLSSLADALPSPHAPSYGASKAALSRYLEGLAMALKPKGIKITNVRFGFVDTKMAKAEVKPFMISTEAAADRILKAIDARRPPMRLSHPLSMSVAMALMSLAVWARLLFA